jgi:hypothetical protein
MALRAQRKFVDSFNVKLGRPNTSTWEQLRKLVGLLKSSTRKARKWREEIAQKKLCLKSGGGTPPRALAGMLIFFEIVNKLNRSTQ